MSPLSDRRDGAPDASASPGERIRSARYVLIAAAAAFVLAAAVGYTPYIFTLGAIVFLVLVAAFAPRRPAGLRNEGAPTGRASVWPDSSMKAVVTALPQASFILDAAGTVRFANARAAEQFAATRAGDPFALTFRWPEIGDCLA